MLGNNHICKVQSQNFKLMQQQWMQTHLTGDNISVLMPLRQMLAENPSMTYQFASEAYKLFVATGRCKESDFQDSYEQLALYGVAMSNFFLSYNTNTENFALYTSSYSILEALAHQGVLKGKKDPIQIELQKLKNTLVESDRVKSSMKKGDCIQAVRLDPEVCGNTVVFTATVPRSQLNINEEVLISYQAMDFAMAYINQILQEKILRVTMGEKVRVVTKNYSILAMIYGEARAKYLISRAYDPRIESFYVPSVGASIYTAGITNLKLKDVDKIEVIQSIQDIDLSEVKLDYSKAKDFFIKSVKGMSAEQIHKLGDICMLGEYNLTAKAAKESLADSYVNSVNDRELYDMMKAHQDLFDLSKYNDLPNKFGNDFEQVEVPTSIKDLEELLKTGVFKILITARKGGLSTIIGTNSSKELARVYGKAYYSKYESEGNRLRALEKAIRDKYKDSMTVEQLCKERKKYGLEYICSDVNLEVNAPDEVLGEDDIKHVMMEIYQNQNAIENRKTVVKQPGLVTIRSCEAYVGDDGAIKNFYKNIDLKSVISIIRLSNVTAKKGDKTRK